MKTHYSPSIESCNQDQNASYEEVINGFEIYIEPNSDRYRGGFEWSVCRDGCELSVGLEFRLEAALEEAREVVSLNGFI